MTISQWFLKTFFLFQRYHPLFYDVSSLVKKRKAIKRVKQMTQIIRSYGINAWYHFICLSLRVGLDMKLPRTKWRHCCNIGIMTIKEPGLTLLCIQLASKSCVGSPGKLLRKLSPTSPSYTRQWLFRKSWYNHRQMETKGKEQARCPQACPWGAVCWGRSIKVIPYPGSPRWSYCNFLTLLWRCSESPNVRGS